MQTSARMSDKPNWHIGGWANMLRCEAGASRMLSQVGAWERGHEHAELPEYWPAIYSINIDEDGRIWVLTINEGDRMLQWLVLIDQGKIIGKGNLPEELSLKWLLEKPKIVIKNGSFYTNEVNPENGADRLVRYSIEFK